MTPTVSKLCAFHHALYHWYTAHGRHDLPWRKTRDPYPIYLSEVMLQQTQVATVLSRFYFPFLEQFPTLEELAAADEAQVLKAWEGLGYYTRARNLHKTARLSGGNLPSSIEALMALPGIGKNTAHAIAAFAHEQPVALCEANIKRVLARIFALKNPSDDQLWQCAEQLLDTANPFDYNQAMMDFGSLICTAKNPDCAHCPATSICQGKSSPLSYPQKKEKRKTPLRKNHILVVQNQQEQIYAPPRRTAFLQGMHHFIELDANEDGIMLNDQLILLSNCKQLGHVRQTYSHFTLQADVYWLTFTGLTGQKNWHSVEALHALPMSGAEQKILALIIPQTKKPCR